MTHSIQVQFVNKSASNDPHDMIHYVGGINPAGSKWRLSGPDAIAGMECGKWRFYITLDGHAVWLVIAKDPVGHKYLKTEIDSVTPDLLLNLPDYPAN